LISLTFIINFASQKLLRQMGIRILNILYKLQNNCKTYSLTSFNNKQMLIKIVKIA